MNDKDSKLISEAYEDVNKKFDYGDLMDRFKNYNPEAEYNKQKEALEPHLKNPKLQDLTDKLHSAMCDKEHTERCAYHYGNWRNDIRSEMLDYFGYVMQLLKKYSYTEVEKMIETLIEAQDIKDGFNKVFSLGQEW